MGVLGDLVTHSQSLPAELSPCILTEKSDGVTTLLQDMT